MYIIVLFNNTIIITLTLLLYSPEHLVVTSICPIGIVLDSVSVIL